MSPKTRAIASPPTGGVAKDSRVKGSAEPLYGLPPGAGASDLAIGQFQRQSLSEGLPGLARPGVLWFCLLMEGFRSESELRAAWAELRRRYRGPYGVCLDWHSDGRPHRRLLGAPTVVSAGQLRKIPPYDHAMEEWMDIVEKATGSRPTPARLIAAALVRLHTCVPGDSYAHIAGDVELTTVSRSCLVRLAARKALAAPASLVEDALLLRRSVREAVADAALLGEASTASARNNALSSLAKACLDSHGGSAKSRRDRMLIQLDGAGAGAELAGGWIAVIWGWCVSLVQSGTRRTKPLEPSSIEQYVRRTLVPLIGALAGHSPADMADIDWSKVRDDVLARVTEPTQINKVSAAFASFHEFLEDTYGITASSWPADDEGPALLPRANVIWPHEADWVQRCLASVPTPNRFDSQVLAAFAFWSCQPTRAEDLWRCHMFSIRDDEEGELFLYLDPLQDAPNGKTVNSRRGVAFVGWAATSIRAWIARRRDELSTLPEEEQLKALLFGSVEHPRRPWRVGATVQRVSDWLKAATGDPTVSMYTLRHSSLTFARLDAQNQREVDLQSARAGHAKTSTSEVHYMHLPEVVLRRALDREQETVRLKAREVAAICGLTVDTVCQRWNRGKKIGVPRATTSWRAILECADRQPLNAAQDGFALCDPVALPTRTPDRGALSAITILQCLEDRCAGLEDELVCARRDVGQETLDALERALWVWSNQHGLTAEYLKQQIADTYRARVPFAAGFQKRFEEKTACVAEALRRGETPEKVRGLTSAWRVSLQNDYIGFAHRPSSHELLQWLAQTGIDGSQLVMWSTRGDRSDLLDEMEAIFGAPPTSMKLNDRSGRPPEYLGLVSKGVKPSPSSTSIARLNALLFALWAFAHMQGLQ